MPQVDGAGECETEENTQANNSLPSTVLTTSETPELTKQVKGSGQEKQPDKRTLHRIMKAKAQAAIQEYNDYVSQLGAHDPSILSDDYFDPEEEDDGSESAESESSSEYSDSSETSDIEGPSVAAHTSNTRKHKNKQSKSDRSPSFQSCKSTVDEHDVARREALAAEQAAEQHRAVKQAKPEAKPRKKSVTGKCKRSDEAYKESRSQTKKNCYKKGHGTCYHKSKKRRHRRPPTSSSDEVSSSGSDSSSSGHRSEPDDNPMPPELFNYAVREDVSKTSYVVDFDLSLNGNRVDNFKISGTRHGCPEDYVRLQSKKVFVLFLTLQR